jgi:hypothetical protein
LAKWIQESIRILFCKKSEKNLGVFQQFEILSWNKMQKSTFAYEARKCRSNQIVTIWNEQLL